MTLLVRDEEDILRANLDFHLAHGVDEFVLMDNRSVDGTADIAREYERAGCLRYVFQPQDDYSQSRWVTAMAERAVRELEADWVIHSDADEFWCPHDGSLKDELRAVDPDVAAVCAERTNFVARPRDDDAEPFWRRMNVRHIRSLNSVGNPLPAKIAHRGIPGVVVGQGNHQAWIDGAPVRPDPVPITILHFPVRSRAQYMNKIAKGGAAYARNTELGLGYGRTWREAYRKFLDGRFDEAFAKELFSDDDVERGLAAGSLVRDDRLISALSANPAPVTKRAATT